MIAVLTASGYTVFAHAPTFVGSQQENTRHATALQHTQSQSDNTKEIDTRSSADSSTTVQKTDTAVVVSLENKQVQILHNRRITQTFPIQRIGNTESGCVISEGRFSIKEKNSHFSKDTTSYLPSYVRVRNQLYIHGRAIVQDTNVQDTNNKASQPSKGCIQLSRADASTLFDTVTAETPVIVRTDSVHSINNTASSVSDAPNTHASSYLIADMTTGDILARQNETWQRPIASLAKLMTAVVAKETFDSSTRIPITESAVATEGRRGRLSAGDTISLQHILYPLLLSSSNDAAAVLAERLGTKHFVQRMNDTAERIGMKDTHFTDPAGLKISNTATTIDLLTLTQYIQKHHPEIFTITSNTHKTLPQRNSIAHDNYTNTHPLAEKADFVGGKNG
ncbi:MAG: hypothetical protein BRC24_00810, partial [Parcubacteria group bacterium SW_4_46_8]